MIREAAAGAMLGSRLMLPTPAHNISKIPAAPMPPPMHMVTRP